MEIRNYREHNPADKTLAEFDVYIPALEMTLRRWKMIRGRKGGVFPVPSSYSEGQDPDKVWFKYVEIGEKRKADFDKCLREALKPFMRPGMMD